MINHLAGYWPFHYTFYAFRKRASLCRLEKERLVIVTRTHFIIVIPAILFFFIFFFSPFRVRFTALLRLSSKILLTDFLKKILRCHHKWFILKIFFDFLTVQFVSFIFIFFRRTKWPHLNVFLSNFYNSNISKNEAKYIHMT